jgi:hypothetical protein
MASYFDDNFGAWSMESEDDVDFYHTVQRRSVTKRCEGCRRRVRILPEYAYCNACADKVERGWDFGE